MHEAAYRALGLPHTYEKIETRADELPARVAALRAGAFAGLNVTVPHKSRVLELADVVEPSAAATGAANTLVRTSDGAIHAHNTDAPALREELVRLAGDPIVFRGRSALVLGSGGAARAAIFALGQLGVGRVTVRARSEKKDLAAVLTASVVGSPAVVAGGNTPTLAFEPLVAPSTEAADLCAIVQATTAGMHGSAAPGELVADAVAWASVPASCVVYDVVYVPPLTPLVQRASARHLSADSGLGMLVGQGALAFELWLGIRPPRDVMRRALG